jgi:hypothetical protein
MMAADWDVVSMEPAELSDSRVVIAQEQLDGAVRVPSGTGWSIPPDELRAILFKHFDPNCGHEAWFGVISAIHYTTAGSDEGLHLADEWSSKATRKSGNGQPAYLGFDHVKYRWGTLSLDRNKRLKTDAMFREKLPPAKAEEFEIIEAQADARAVISLDEGELHNYAAQCEQLLEGDVYVREQQLVRIGGAKDLASERSGTVQRDESQAVIIPATAEYLRRRLSELAHFRRYRRREKAHVWVDCPKELAHNIAGQGDWPTLRQLKAIARAPFVRPDGSICETPGYDPAASVFYQPNAEFLPVPVNPTREDAAEALTVLLAPFAELPFATEAARGAFVAHILTEAVRSAISTSPVFLYTAPWAGSGKTLASEMPSRIVHGCGPALRPWADGEELRKSLFSSLLAGDRTIGFDNLPNGVKVRSPILCGFLTADPYSDRKLGASEAPSLPNRSVVSLTGNNITPAGDLARRSIVIRLDANVTNLRERRFGIADLRGHVAANRPALLVAALTIICAHMASGWQRDKPPLPSFEHWSRLVREPLLWLGMADPVATQDDESDDEAMPLAEAFKGMAEHPAIGGKEFTSGDLAKMCDPLLSDDALVSAIEAAGCSEPTDPTRIGYWLREKRDQIAGGWKLVAGAKVRGGGRKYQLRGMAP